MYFSSPHLFVFLFDVLSVAVFFLMVTSTWAMPWHKWKSKGTSRWSIPRRCQSAPAAQKALTPALVNLPCFCHQGQICKKADLCLSIYPCVIKYYLILSLFYLPSPLSSTFLPYLQETKIYLRSLVITNDDYIYIYCLYLYLPICLWNILVNRIKSHKRSKGTLV